MDANRNISNRKAIASRGARTRSQVPETAVRQRPVLAVRKDQTTVARKNVPKTGPQAVPKTVLRTAQANPADQCASLRADFAANN